MKKWMDMSNLSLEFRERVDRLERNFEVVTVIFKKFEPIFMDIFQNPHEEPPRLPRSRKQRKLQCSAKDLFSFCWTLFVYSKGNFCLIGDDLVNSYHLLLCCLDLIYTHVLQCPNKEDLLNPTFAARLPAPESCTDDIPCIIGALCDHYDGIFVEAKGIKEHYFKPYISKLYDKKILKGCCLLDVSSFTDNNKTLNKEYEEYVLTKGDFDERVFLGVDAEEEIGSPRKFLMDVPMGNCTPRKLTDSNLQQHFEKKRSFAPSTPLTGRKYLKEEPAVITPVSSATQCVSRLQSMVAGLRNAPSEQLIEVFKSCVRNPFENVLNIARDLGHRFCQHYTQSTDDHAGSHIDFATNRWKLAEILYFKVLETIVVQETRRLLGKDMTALLEQDIFHRSLIACCLEIVLFAYTSPRIFPWTIEVLNLSAFYFYKVIEVFIRSEEGLSRDMVKHLNSIEEQILESRAWTSDSVLWTLVETNESVPTCEEVIIPSNFETGNEAGVGHLPMMPVSPIVHPRLKEVRTDIGGPCRRDCSTFSPLSVHDRYSSPAAGSAKRRLFGDDCLREPVGEKLTTPDITRIRIALSLPAERMCLSPDKAGTTTGQRLTLAGNGAETESDKSLSRLMKTSPPQKENDIPVPLTAQALISPSPKHQLGRMQDPCPTSANRPRKTGSLALFFRKVYHLASVRLRDLCLKLDVSNELRRKIWTLFEFTLVHCTDLMKDRHLDQLLLCAVYIMAKICKEERLFHDIMKCYRNQPQANSHVYRNVLLKRLPQTRQDELNVNQDVEMIDCDSNDSHPTPNGLSVGICGQAERGDLIAFYNNVYVERVKSFALKYAFASQENLQQLSDPSHCPPVQV
ncbi:hypothetical protein GDO86_013930 [Hymenochirus boettgeri]|uniref:Retinoblastoma-like protein 1 n=1 Tax=Hymenochirus boettgeri TaxID=247094 RepID=A0A8T2JPQ4_9PIPI|nr:hypothetical protein GDO86_013930 [Hymenochirus boettgeri]